MAPSILAADFSRLSEQILSVTTDASAAHRTDILHWDVMDGHFVPNISFGAGLIERCRGLTGALFDVHLMITDPVRYCRSFVDAGADVLTFHAELIDEPARVIDAIREAADKASRPCAVGLALNPHTGLDRLEAVLESLDLVLVMSVFPGFGGQAFMPGVLPKARQIRQRLSPRQRLEIDGGIGPRTIIDAAAAGVDTFVAGTSVFGQPTPAAAMAALRELALSVAER